MQQQPSAVFRNKRNGIFPSQEVSRYCKKSGSCGCHPTWSWKNISFPFFFVFHFFPVWLISRGGQITTTERKRNSFLVRFFNSFFSKVFFNRIVCIKMREYQNRPGKHQLAVLLLGLGCDFVVRGFPSPPRFQWNELQTWGLNRIVRGKFGRKTELGPTILQTGLYTFRAPNFYFIISTSSSAVDQTH